MSPEQVVADYVGGFEGLLSVQPADNGNWYDAARFKARLPQRRNMGALVGSMRGVTAYAYATFYGRTDITRAVMASITLPQAVDIGMGLFFSDPGLRFLLWNRVTAAVLDKCWGSGTGTTILHLQREIGAAMDGKIGSGGETAAKYAAWIARLSEEGAARRWCAIREAWDTSIATNEGLNDPDHVFLNGWIRRDDSFLPGTPWWNSFGR